MPQDRSIAAAATIVVLLAFAIIGSLIVCTVTYMAVAAVLTGVVPFRQFGVADPMAVAVDVMNLPWFGRVVKLGAIAGLFSVILTTTYGRTRVFYTISRDGLLPALFSRVHAKRRTPHIGTLVLGGAIALATGPGTTVSSARWGHPSQRGQDCFHSRLGNSFLYPYGRAAAPRYLRESAAR